MQTAPDRMTAAAFALLCLATPCLATLSGCARDARVEVSGKVTVDGQLLAEGLINFDPADKIGPTAGAVVRDGAYALRLRPGAKTVRIDGFKMVGQRPFNPSDPKGVQVPIKESIVSKKYLQAPLSAAIGPAGGQFDFAVDGNGS